MSLIGSLSDNCAITKIYIRGTVHIIKVYTDISGVRALYMKLTNGREYKYGKKDNLDLTVTQFDFEKGAQMLGVYGRVVFDNQEIEPDELLTLGFYRDECSMTRQLYITPEERQN